MEIFYTQLSLQNYLDLEANKGKTIGFVPTMGALHQGHIQLLNQSKVDCDVNIVSIFVNPTQFNDPDDLEKYPRTPEKDADRLSRNGCDVLFMPEISEVYPDDSFKTIELDLGRLGTAFEAAKRPGHYEGVVAVVKRLFDLVKPTIAYFGQKDFQQWLVINKLVSEYEIPVQLKMVATEREQDGLAMSSRNGQLSAAERREATFIYKTMKKAYSTILSDPTRLSKAKTLLELEFKNNWKFSLDYSDICNTIDLMPLDDLTNQESCIIIIAAKLGRVRLIDNLLIQKDEWQ